MAAILYGEAFGRQRPKDVVATLSARSKRTHTLGESFTDHLRARAEAEEAYSKVRSPLASELRLRFTASAIR